jgi:hypothetical protein
MTIKTVECCMCGADIEYEEFKQVPGYCGDICCKQDIEKQISERGYFVPYIPLQISKIIFKEDNKDSKYCPKCAFPVGEDLKSVPYYISGQKCPNCGFLEDKP